MIPLLFCLHLSEDNLCWKVSVVVTCLAIVAGHQLVRLGSPPCT